MGIERARVVEVHAADSVSGLAGSAYQVDARLVLTHASLVGRAAPTFVRSSRTGSWVEASVAWRGGAALLEVDDPSALLVAARPLRWGEVVGRRPVAVAAMGFSAAPERSRWVRDPMQFSARLSSDGSVEAGAPGMVGAALFAGNELVGVHDGGRAAVSAAALAADPSFAELVGGISLVRVETPASAFPMLP